MRQSFAVLVENKPGVMARVSNLFRRRGFNIESISVGVTNDPKISRMTLVVEGDERRLEQVKKQLNKLIETIKVIDIPPDNCVERELALIKVSVGPEQRSEVIQIADVFRARIVDLSQDSLIIEVTGDGDKIDAMVKLLEKFGIEEIARTGKAAMVRGQK